EVRLTVEDKHLNRAETLHGGIMATLLDVACGYEANLVPKPDKDTFMVTVSLTTNFIAAGKRGDDLLATATTVGGGRSVKYVQGALYNQDGKVIATASGIFRKTG
ncbi:MAG: PaaI family thioesterase, partial [Pseudomonadota bacterium]